ncbi:MAG: hypothetical protein R2731_02255 [Nocardioides sp.]
MLEHLQPQHGPDCRPRRRVVRQGENIDEALGAVPEVDEDAGAARTPRNSADCPDDLVAYGEPQPRGVEFIHREHSARAVVGVLRADPENKDRSGQTWPFLVPRMFPISDPDPKTLL